MNGVVITGKLGNSVFSAQNQHIFFYQGGKNGLLAPKEQLQATQNTHCQEVLGAPNLERFPLQREVLATWGAPIWGVFTPKRGCSHHAHPASFFLWPQIAAFQHENGPPGGGVSDQVSL